MSMDINMADGEDDVAILDLNAAMKFVKKKKEFALKFGLNS